MTSGVVGGIGHWACVLVRTAAVRAWPAYDTAAGAEPIPVPLCVHDCGVIAY